MILDVIKTDTVFKVEVKNLNQTRVPKGLGFLKYENSYSILIDKELYMIDIVDKNKSKEIDFFFLKRNYTAIVNIIESIRDKFFTMEIIFFSFPIQEVFIPFYISLDEKILETAKKRKIIVHKDNIDKLRDKLKEKITLKINGENYFLVSTAISSEKEIFEEELSKIGQNIKNIEKSKNLDNEEKMKYIEENQENIEKIKSQKKDLAFSIYGENIHLPVKKDITKSGDYRFNATKLVLFKNSIKKDSIRLIKGDIEFKNGLVSEKVVKDLKDIVESEGSYLNTWDKYLEKEGEILLDKAKEIGILNILKTSKVEDGYELKIENTSQYKDLLNEGEYLSFLDEVPNYIKNNLSWLEHIAKIAQEDALGIKNNKDKSFEIKTIEHGFITIKTDENISDLKSKKVVLSIYGDEIQLKRKLEARKRLHEERSANPLLGLIIEDTETIKKYLNTTKTKELEPLTTYVKDKIFSNPPTQNQVDAIDLALNTPDIAIIQGPPGTGKTTVLTAIIERLNEEADKENIKGQVLVVGFQHDAVENIIQRLDINGIPTPKFGKKSTTMVDMNSYERVIEWSDKIAHNLKDKLPELSNQLKINRLNQYFEIYLKTPSTQIAIELLKYIRDELSIYLKDEIVMKSKEILDALRMKKVNTIKELQSIYALRTTKKGFLDDGRERNLDLLVSNIGKILSNEQKSVLEFKTIDNLDEYLKNLENLKYTLIDRLYPKPMFRAEKPNGDIIKLKEEVEEQLSQSSSSKDKMNTILSNYINELKCNPFGLKSMIEEYSYVYSSTTGQSNKATKQKINNEDVDVSFDTVIVDEAARVAPMDLLIVMVLAKRRIILVGDHRQLPHMLDEDVIKSSELSANEFINESIFGYLKKRALKLETFDNIKRAITLENQYRTHPKLGKFISDNFYKPHNEEFSSPLGTTVGKIEDFFYQNLNGIENTPAIWIDVKYNFSNDNPRSRVCEAKQIIKKLRLWINSENGKNLDFGIITFYRDQVNTIKKELEKEFTKEERDGFSNRLRIGTVDSFQGMEFDIVFLSIVRSRDIETINDNLKDYRLFGFLISKNRLCVSMSRQKKSLIVVGDKKFFDSDRAKQDVEELHNFLQLCKNEGKVL